MFQFAIKDKRRKEALLLEIDQKLAGLPADRQNLAAAYALGLREGLRLGGGAHCDTEPQALVKQNRRNKNDG